MDEIQRTLVKAGRKDLAQEYYQKVAAKKKDLKPIDKAVKKDFLQTRREVEKMVKKIHTFSNKVDSRAIGKAIKSVGNLLAAVDAIARDERFV